MRHRKKIARLSASLFVVCYMLAACVRSGDEDRLVVLSNGENVGHVIAQHNDRNVSVDYMVNNNGRGPKISESLLLDSGGFPLRWTISGSSLFGADVNESYAWERGGARWASQADQGTASTEKPLLYVANDASPWSLGLYARALLAAPDHTLEILPSGRLKIQELHRTTVGDDELPITIYSLGGIGLAPQMLVLDDSGKLFAELGGRSVIVREGYESAADSLLALSRDLEFERIKGLQHELRHEFTQPVRINNVHVFDPSAGRRGELSSVVFDDGLIVAVEAPLADSSPAGEVVVDGDGGTLVPGLFDMHSHSSLNSGLFYLAAGVTSTRDMGNDIELIEELLHGIETGELPGPRITRAGLIEARSPYSARIGIVAESLDEALDAVRWYADHGYYEIKTYNSMNPEWVAPIVAEAKKHGLGVTGHVPAFMSPDAVIEAGYNSIAHINQLMLGWLLEPGEDTRTPLRLTGMKRAVNLDVKSEEVQHTIALMREHGTAQDTTAIILERLMKSRAGTVQPGDEPYLDHMPIGYQRYRKRTFVPLDEPRDDAAYVDAFDNLLDVILELHRNGIQLLVGTDDSTGVSVHRELELYVAAGISPAETLALATKGAAQYLQQADRVGSIEPGMYADFLLVPGDPTTDISAIRQIRLVASRGIIYFPADIYEALNIRPFADKPAVQVPEGAAL